MPEEQTQQIPEDIFDNPDEAAPFAPAPQAPLPSVARAVSPPPAPPSPPAPPAETTVFDETPAIPSARPRRVWLRIILVLAVLAILIAAGFFAWIWLKPPALLTGLEAIPPLTAEQDAVPAASQPAEQPAGSVLTEPQAPPAAPIDTDGDGLIDSEEQAKGTNPAIADTDQDGLTDYEEVVFYHTDPLKNDTDGDTYFDGTEVRNGYSPTDPSPTARLFVVPTE